MGILHGGREYSLAAVSGHNFALASHSRRDWHQVYIKMTPITIPVSQKSVVINIERTTKEMEEIAHVNPIC